MISFYFIVIPINSKNFLLYQGPFFEHKKTSEPRIPARFGKKISNPVQRPFARFRRAILIGADGSKFISDKTRVYVSS